MCDAKWCMACATAGVWEQDWNCYVSIPSEYILGDYQVAVTQENFETEALGMDEDGNGIEQCTLITYRIRNTKSRYAED